MSRIQDILKKVFLEPHKIPAFCLKKVRTVILWGRSCFLTLAVLFFKGKTPFPRLIGRIPSLKNMVLTMVDIGFRGGLCLEWSPLHEKGFHLFSIIPSEHTLKTFNRGYIRRDRVRFRLENSFSSGFLLSFDAPYFKDSVWDMNNAKRFERNDENVVQMAMIYYSTDSMTLEWSSSIPIKIFIPARPGTSLNWWSRFVRRPFSGKSCHTAFIGRLLKKLHWPLGEGFAQTRILKRK